ncbi:hypothetical protein FB45DRAFT_1006281 [Roridomyces roridus]|uniref:Uncharacterized protein n=1 Tax=Roridomyces roridus TaxID=1738132 RepID=A0AAD7FG69_9AGAR|nr:hypothetical protein FB45DRAFT_1006281 [Roridomyces roridus]
MYEDHKAQDDPVAFSKFLKSQRAAAKDIKSAAFNCAFWARHRVLDVVERRNRDCWRKILKSVEKRLLREGWAAVDIQAAAWNYEKEAEVRHLHTIRTLTHRLWKRLRPYIVWHVALERAPRLRKERGQLCYRRKKCIQHAALNTLSELVPGHDNIFYPPPHELTELPPLVELVRDPSQDELSPDDPRVIAFLTSSEARAFMDGWLARTQAHLVSLLPTTTATSENHDQSVDRHPNHLELINRATSVFRFPCISHGGLGVGWEFARGHMHVFGDEVWRYRKSVEFSEQGRATAQSLVDLLGMHNEVSAAEMDGKGARFVCGRCPIPSHGRQALQWRECIQHDVEEHKTPSWFLVSPLATADLLRREEEDTPARRSMAPTWPHAAPCERRRSSPPQWKFKLDLELHRDPWLKPLPPMRARILEAGKRPAIFRCTHCAVEEPDIVKLFNERSIWVHVVDKHAYVGRRPDERDWTKVELLMPRLA